MSHKTAPSELLSWGWSAFYEEQLGNPSDLGNVGRVIALRRGSVEVLCTSGVLVLPTGSPLSDGQKPVTGDWVLVSHDRAKVERTLTRKSILSRRYSGSEKIQELTANIDHVFILTSCNDEFSESRIERFLILAYSADVDITVLLTKADLCQTPEDYECRARQIILDHPIHLINVTDSVHVNELLMYFEPNQTIALLGSSGVGKSTLVNLLSRAVTQQTGTVRAKDQRGRHTTTERRLVRLPTGGMVIDTPGMRSVSTTGSIKAVNQCFRDIVQTGTSCRFANCTHEKEPGCRISEAILSGHLSRRRVENYRKMLLECPN